MILHDHTEGSSSPRALLLAPAGNIDVAAHAFAAGADAVYVGLKGASRGGVRNELTFSQLHECAQLARRLGKAVHCALNVIPRQQERGALLRQLDAAAACGVHAVILNDVGIIREVRRALPSLSITASIGCAALNPADALFYQDLGVTGVVFPGYLDPREIMAIKRCCSIQVEVMVHMVQEFNQLGKCWMPSYVNFAAAERLVPVERLSGSVKRGGVGPCYHICQQPWILSKDSRRVAEPLLPARQISRFADLSAFLNAGVDVIKLQGRSLAPEQVAALVAVYRTALDSSNTGATQQCNAIPAALPPMWTVQGR